MLQNKFWWERTGVAVVAVAPYYSFDATKRAIAALKLNVEEVSKTEISKISAAGWPFSRIGFSFFFLHLGVLLSLAFAKPHTKGDLYIIYISGSVGSTRGPKLWPYLPRCEAL